jgi:asparagine synthase (glutamine-hydrolysing)
MCGIAGVLYSDSARLVARGVLEGMARAIAHRGPDGEGLFAEPGVGLVHRRLAIIDLATGGQPLGNEDGSVQVVFNGEIYNFEELRRSLVRRGHLFRTRSDTEVLVHLYEDHGADLVRHLRGMFAFAIWDRRLRRLVLARDRIGIKPLYILRDAEKFVFGSEIKAILAHPDVRREIDPVALDAYLACGVVPAPRSIFRDVEKLPPAHVLTVSADRLATSPRRYWQLAFEPNPRLTPGEWQERIRAKVGEAVGLALVSDVPVGAFLSGGIDSSVVVASACRRAGGLETFSIGLEDPRSSELPFASLVAQRYGTRHAEDVVTPDAARALDVLVHHYDEPFADSSAVPTFLVSRLARHRVKVVLSGDGGDELFGGYTRYSHDLMEAALRSHLPRWIRRRLIGPAAGLWPRIDWLPRPLRAKTLLTNLALEPDAAYANSISTCRLPLRRRLLAADLRLMMNGHEALEAVRRGYRTAPDGDPLSAMIAADIEMLLPDDYLVKVDRASMANGLEVRPPLLDHELLEMAASIPSEWKIRGGHTKWILKRAFAGDLPEATTTRAKQGFEVPVGTWIRGPLRGLFQETVLTPGRPVEGLIDQGAARQTFSAHVRGTSDHGSVLWSLLVLGRWADRYLRDTGRPAA